MNFAQSAFRKFHLLIGRDGTELMVVDDSIIDAGTSRSVRGLADSHMFQDWQNTDPDSSMCPIVLSGSYEAASDHITMSRLYDDTIERHG